MKRCDDCGDTLKPTGPCGVGHFPLCPECVRVHNDRHAEDTKRDLRQCEVCGGGLPHHDPRFHRLDDEIKKLRIQIGWKA